MSGGVATVAVAPSSAALVTLAPLAKGGGEREQLRPLVARARTDRASERRERRATALRQRRPPA